MKKAKASMGNGLYSNKNNDLVKRIIFLLLSLIVYRLGSHIPVPGINPDALANLFINNRDGILGLFNMFSGGALSRFSIFALGIMPYISASIIVQLMSVVLPSLEALKKDGEIGRKQLTQYTRYFTVILATIQSIGISIVLESQKDLVINPGFLFELTTVFTLVAGTMFLMWLGEQITEKAIGNGISVIIFAGIVSELPSAITALLDMVSSSMISMTSSFLILLLIISVTLFVVFVELAQRKININYAKRQMGNKIYGGQSSHLPLKLNMAGVIPPIFASSIILFPSTVSSWFSNGNNSMLSYLATILAPRQPIYLFLYTIAIIFFCFFYTAIVFNSKETSDNLKKSGAFIPGIRPGEYTARYIDKILTRLTLSGAIYIAIVCLIPELLVMYWHVPFNFSGTSLLIIVVVTMDFMTQIQTHIMSTQYESLIKKINKDSYLTKK
ncbi:preprotein translocase subunit SecY [Candidatus Kinetoplastibacterium sorsogonicusi]|uniref:preprotein translocase subunit SecY n=1 Tax=Candidatus Kinetoplastidibacterium kentomonadis TaxID=1576550 RepID=UPI003BEF1803